eukprot:356367-Chlamydomonas_euryale.AAC.8
MPPPGSRSSQGNSSAKWYAVARVLELPRSRTTCRAKNTSSCSPGPGRCSGAARGEGTPREWLIMDLERAALRRKGRTLRKAQNRFGTGEEMGLGR